jgi:hypothetical protein
MTPKVVWALASLSGKSAALAAKIDAQTSPVFRVEVIAPSPDVLICRWGKVFTAPTAAQAHTLLGCGRFDRFLGGVLSRHQFAPHHALNAPAACTLDKPVEAIGYSSPIVVRS